MEILVRHLQRLPKQSRAVLQTCLYGLGAGASAVFFQLGINWLYRLGLGKLSQQSTSTFLIGSLAIIVVSSLLMGWLLNSFCREAAGSGIPQLKLAFWKDFGTVPWRVAWVKFVAGIVSIGGGQSLGREGPSVQLAGAVSSNLAGLAGEAKQNRRLAAAAGAAAGLAAAFNTPLAATTFVLEEIIGDLNSRLLGGVLLASVLGALVVHGVIGAQPSFTLTGAAAPSWVGYLLTPVVAALAGLVGVYFQKASLGLRGRMKSTRRVPGWLLPLAGGLITWGLGVAVFERTQRLGVFSLGYDDLSSALAGDIGWQLATVLLAAKFIATFTCYGFGGCGGIFSPTLFFGGITGVALAGLVGLEWPMARADTLTLAVVGMSACLGAVVGAPVTGILIVFEMTHEFALVPVLMIGALVSQAISRKMNRENFYDALLTQDGHHIEHVRPPRDLQSWQQFPVSAIANFRPVIIHDLAPAKLQVFLKSHPYQRFPVVQGDKLTGILTRREAEAALRDNRAPKLENATTCLPHQTVRKLQGLLVESPINFVVLVDDDGGKILGIITLHDLLRAEVEKAGSSDT
ncbi:MAG: chloride channel protein [Verrucomicrobiia bacterium]|jgi:CIC family chloride channel protein